MDLKYEVFMKCHIAMNLTSLVRYIFGIYRYFTVGLGVTAGFS